MNDSIMKRIHFLIGALTLLLAAACSKDGEMLTASLPGEEGITIGSVDTEIVLDKGHAQSLALTLYWDAMGDLVLSNPNAQIPDDVVSQTLQFAAEESFAAPYEALMASGVLSAQYTVSQLNSIVSRLGFEGGVAAPLYVRLKTQLGANAEPRYGNTLQFTVTPYFIDMSRVALRSRDDGTDVATIPALSDGEYAGLATISTEWFNFYFVEGDDTVWGTLNDGSSGTAFALQTTTNLVDWNCWFPQSTGCYYVTMSTSAAEWTATYLSAPSVQIGGESLAMTYHKAQNTWSCVLTTTSDNAAVDLAQAGQLYNQSTGATKGSVPVDRTLSLVTGTDGAFTVVNGSSASGLVAGAAGTYTVLLDITNQTLMLAEGEVEVGGDGGGDEEEDQWPEDPDYAVPTGDKVYIYDIDDAEKPTTVAGTLLSTGNGIYEGFFYLEGWHNFKLGDTEDPSTAKIYGTAPVSEGLYRLYTGEDMYAIWHDSETGAYCHLTVDFNERTWSCEPVTSLEVLGSFNEYKLNANEMTFNVASRTWTATLQAEDWGSGFYLLLNDDRNRCYKDSDLDGRLEFSTSNQGSEFLPAGLEAGKSCRLTVDLNDPENLSYTLTADEGGEEPAPEYPENLYAYYCQSVSSFSGVASRMLPGEKQGTYVGYISTPSSWNDKPYVNFVFGDSETPGAGTVYGVLSDTQYTLDPSGTDMAWFNTLGLHRVTADLTTGTWSEETLSIAVTGDFNGWKLTDTMAFDLATQTWQATCDISNIGYGIQIVLGDWTYKYGGADGVLVTADDNNNIKPETTGTYLITVDLRDAGHLTYTLTKQE